MAIKIKYRVNTGIVLIIGIILILIGFAGCMAREDIFKIGIVRTVPINTQSLEGFKAGMAELGYIEGKNIKYIYREVIDQDKNDIDAGIKEVLSQNIDVLLALGRGVALRAKELVKGTDTPVLFCGDARPIEEGLVKSLSHPGGNLTGVAPADSVAKALEWLITIVPGARKVWLPFNPDDDVSTMEIEGLEKAAYHLGIELIPYQVQSVEEAVTGINNLSEEVKAIFLIPSRTLNTRSRELSQAAISKGIPMGASIGLDESILITLMSDFFDAGKKTARLAHQIHTGIKTTDLPIETSEINLIINLNTAEKIGLAIPNSQLNQATTIIR